MNRPTILILILAAFAAITMYQQPIFAVGAVLGSPVTIIAVLISFIYTDYRSQQMEKRLKKVPVRTKRMIDRNNDNRNM